jgi:2-dehydropantoate 2-reductase
MGKPIKQVSLIGLGALGIMYSEHLSKKMPYEDLRIIADKERINRYTKEGVFCNEERCNFNYVTPEQKVEPADLLIFAVKYTQLQEAIKLVVNHVGKDTIILSVLNGIVSESDIGAVYGNDHNLYCVAQGMTAVKTDNRLIYMNKGILCYGELNESENSEKVLRVKSFFDSIGMPYEINNQMKTKLWSKLMANVGINQTIAYHETTNSQIQQSGPIRDIMITAMEEVIKVATLEEVDLSYQDIDYWLRIFNTLEPEGMPSMAQDVKANRTTEVELFAGTIVKLAHKHGVDVPVNEMFYEYFR